MNRAIQLFYDNPELRGAVHSFLIEFLKNKSLQVSLQKNNEDIGAEARALRVCGQLVDAAFNEMAQFSTKKITGENNEAI